MHTRATSSSSNLERRFACPGSALAEHRFAAAVKAGLAEEADSEASQEGTLLHWYDAHPEDSRDSLDEHQRQALERNAELRERFMLVVREQHGITEDEECREFRDNLELWLCEPDGTPWEDPVTGDGFPGHPDVVRYYPRIRLLVVLDSKFGRIPVPHAAVNWQLKSYLVMAAVHFEVDNAICAITQPWCPAPNNFHAASYTAAHLMEANVDVLEVLDATNNLDAKRMPSAHACQYCKACGTEFCPESLRMDALKSVDINALSIKELEALSPEIEREAASIKKWHDRMLFIAKKFPEMLEFHTLKPTGNTTTIEKPDEALALFLPKAQAILGLTEHEATDLFVRCCKLSKPQFDSAIAKQPHMDPERAVQFTADTFGDLIVTKPKEPSLKRK